MPHIGTDESFLPDFGPEMILAGRYKIVRLLGRGGMAQVFLAEDIKLARPDGKGQRLVAIKTVPRELYGDLRMRKALEREASLVMDLHHSRVRAVHNLEEDPQRKAAFLVMEYVEGISLHDLLAERAEERLTQAEAVEIARQVCEALDCAHSHRPPILHRDIKPKNIFLAGISPQDLDPTNPIPLDKIDVKVADFGLGTVVRDSMSSHRPDASATSGTLPYMAPEQVDGEDATPAVDIYALGVTLYEMLCGHTPFSKGDVYHQIKEKVPPPLAPDLCEPWLWGVIGKCIAKEPKERDQSAGVVINRLAEPQSEARKVAAMEVDPPAEVSMSEPILGITDKAENRRASEEGLKEVKKPSLQPEPPPPKTASIGATYRRCHACGSRMPLVATKTFSFGGIPTGAKETYECSKCGKKVQLRSRDRILLLLPSALFSLCMLFFLLSVLMDAFKGPKDSSWPFAFFLLIFLAPPLKMIAEIRRRVEYRPIQ
jgi:eukaryotic-like serine/threonine-protein kinase